MIKKIFNLLVCICLISGLIVVPASAESDDISNELRAIELRAIELLKTLGMINEEYDEYTIDSEALVTKAEFAYIVANVFAKNLKSDNLYFHDVSKDNWAFESVSVLVEKNIIKLNAERMFYPDEVMTFDEAAKMLINALGYGSAVEILGDVMIEKLIYDLDLRKNVKTNGELTFGNTVVMIYNALIAETMEISSTSGQTVKYSGSGKSYLQMYYDTYFEEGILEGFDGISINTDSVMDGEAVIAGERFIADNMDLAKYLGHTVRYLYYYDEKYDEKTLLWIESMMENGDTVSLNYYENDVTFNPNTYTLRYYDTHKNKFNSEQIDTSVKVVYNGEFVTSGIETLLTAPFDTMTLVSEDGSSNYNLIVICAYENYFVAGIKQDEMGFFDAVTSKYMSLEGVKRVDMFDDEGNAISFEDITVDSVLSVYASQSGERVRVLCSTNIVEGVPQNVEKESGFTSITIDDVKYRTAEKNRENNISIGQPVKLYLDANGNIAMMKNTKNTELIGYLIKLYYNEDDGSLVIKMLTQTGDIVKMPVAEKVKIDSELHKNAELAYKKLGGSKAQAGIIIYDLDENNTVKAIDTVEIGKNENPLASLNLKNEKATLTYRNVGKFGRKIYVDNNTVVLGIPSDVNAAEESDFVVKNKSNLIPDKSYMIETYRISQESGYEEIVVIYDTNWSEQSTSMEGILVQYIKKVVNDEGEVVDCITGYQGAGKVELKCTPEFKASQELEAGDYITISTKPNGAVSNALLRYRHSSSNKPVTTDLYQQTAITSGYVHDVTGKIVAIGNYSGADFDEAIDFGVGTILVYDTEENEISVGTIADLLPYDVVGNECSFVLMHQRYSQSLVNIIYK